MARDTETIYQEIVTAKNNQPELAALDSPSSTAIWQLLFRLFAQIIFWMEQKWDAFKIELQNVVDAGQYGNLPWWYKKVKAFQYGDLLVFVNNKFVYAALDTAKQIVFYASISDERGIVKFKVAKQASGRPIPLTVLEYAALLSYLRQIRPAGIRITLDSLPADKLRSTITVYYNAQLDLATVTTLVEAAYLNYINNTLGFDGTFYINKMIDAIQAIPGIIEEQVFVTDISVKQGSSPYQQFTSKFQPLSGYFEVDTSFPLSTTITYIGV